MSVVRKPSSLGWPRVWIVIDWGWIWLESSWLVCSWWNCAVMGILNIVHLIEKKHMTCDCKSLYYSHPQINSHSHRLTPTRIRSYELLLQLTARWIRVRARSNGQVYYYNKVGKLWSFPRLSKFIGMYELMLVKVGHLEVIWVGCHGHS